MVRLIWLCTCGLIAAQATGEARGGVLEQDARRMLTRQNAGIMAVGLALAAAAHSWDNDVNGRLEGVSVLEATSEVSNLYGSSAFNLSAGFGLWIYARATGRAGLEGVSFDLLRALGFVQVVAGPIKYAARRERPDGSNRLSFPSGHTANAFAIAAVLDRRYGRRVGIPLYTWGAFTGAGRLEDDKHYLSDLVAGAALGYVIGRSMTRTSGLTSRAAIAPVPGGLRLTVRFGD